MLLAYVWKIVLQQWRLQNEDNVGIGGAFGSRRCSGISGVGGVGGASGVSDGTPPSCCLVYGYHVRCSHGKSCQHPRQGNHGL